MSPPVRLLWLIDSLTVGGAEALVVPFARRLDRERFELIVCSLSTIAGNPIEQRLREDGVSVVNLGARSLRDFAAFRRLEALVRAERIDLVHAHLTYSAIWSAVLSWRTGIPSVSSLHVAPAATRSLHTSMRYKVASSIRDRLMRFALRRWASRVIMVSAALRDVYLEGGGMRRGAIRVVHNGIELQHFRQERVEARKRLEREFDLPPDQPILATVSVLREGKGIEVLLASMHQVPRGIFLIVGDGPKAAEWRELASRKGVEDRIRWAGYRQDVHTLLGGCDLFVHPTLSDAFPTVLLEAMAAGLPIVASNVGGVPEIVEQNVTGLLVEPGDPAGLAAAIAELLADGARARRMGERGRAIAEQRFSIEAWIGRLATVYTEVFEESALQSR